MTIFYRSVKVMKSVQLKSYQSQKRMDDELNKSAKGLFSLNR